jgi:hypothetical protein
MKTLKTILAVSLFAFIISLNAYALDTTKVFDAEQRVLSVENNTVTVQIDYSFNNA